MEQLVTAIVGQPFGVEGFLRLVSLSGENAHLVKLSAVLLREPSLGKKSEKKYVIEQCKQNGAVLLVKFKGIETPEAAKQLCGSEVLVERSNAANLGAGEFYIEDLKGIRLVDEGGLVRAEICDIVEGGGALLAEIRLLSSDGGAGKIPAVQAEKRFIPFRNEFIGEISLEKNTAILLNSWILE
ncbi:MAG: ribosome maturation factor RimM [Spirochaetaceae bacterium]|jgi:16S rRNA processing protein RimM|nr:ribosome maturation factor RimM [Spirochaetaceae bacterium]